ncbi:hypothetical protein HAX54_050062, partial [Datura stramonium]|nr:hypothetical protein [Datura stramonium]
LPPSKDSHRSGTTSTTERPMYGSNDRCKEEAHSSEQTGHTNTIQKLSVPLIIDNNDSSK